MMLMGNTFFLYLSGIYNKRRGRVCPPLRNFPSEIAAVLSVKTGDRLSKPYRQWWKFTLQQKSASCFSAGCAQSRLWIFSGKWDKFGTFCPKIACFSQFYIVATTQNKSIGFIVGIIFRITSQRFVMLYYHGFVWFPNIRDPSWFTITLAYLMSICCPWRIFAVRRNTQ